MTTVSASPVAAVSLAVMQMTPAWQMAAALMGGTAAMRAGGKTYLPEFEKEKPTSYNRRLKRSTLFPAYNRTVISMTGKPFSRPPTITKLSGDWEEWFKNIDLQGTNITAFAAMVFHAALGKGLAGVLVDVPVRPENTPNTVAAEKAVGIRPYMTAINCENLLGWKAKVIDGNWQLTMLRFKEWIDEEDPADKFTPKSVEQIRVLTPGAWETWRRDPNRPEVWVPYQNGQTTVNFVPFQPFYGRKLGFMCAEPPLIDLAFLNVKHWQSQSDQDNILSVARVPILAIATDDDKFEIEIGSGIGVRIPADGELKFVEHTGKAIEAGAASLSELKDEMRQAGAELLVMRMTQATATEVKSDDTVGTCELQRMVTMFQDSFNGAIDMMAQFAKTPKPEDIVFYNDFGSLSINEASAQLLLDACVGNKLSDETFFKELQRRGVVAPELKYEEEKVKIEANKQPIPTVVGGDPNDPNNPNDPNADPTKKPKAKPPLKT